MITREEFSIIADNIQDEWQMSGLASSIYEEFAWEIYKRIEDAKKIN